ncbi:amidase domain-containing protein [Candidatus Uhrbacteria bacterium]|nr:amidase domain-containing protein [Candidatus Uhrbacteria bacterium]
MFAFTADAFAGSYDGDDAADYADTYWQNYNPAYTSFECDCTNFVSQCLYAGGWEETGSEVDDPDAWFYNGSSTSQISEIWRLVDDLEDFLDSSGRASGPYPVTGPYYSYYLPGDVVFASWDGDGDMEHAYIVTGVYSTHLELTAHTNDRHDITTTEIRQIKNSVYFEGWFLYSSY